MSERLLRLFVTVGARQFVAHVRTDALPGGAGATVGQLVDGVRHCPRYAALCGDGTEGAPRVFLGAGAFELLPTEPAAVLRDGDEITLRFDGEPCPVPKQQQPQQKQEQQKQEQQKQEQQPPPRDLQVAACAAAESTEPVERTPRAVRRVVHYDSDGEVASVAEVPATRAPVAALPVDGDDSTEDAATAVTAVTPERKRRRRRSRHGRRAAGDAEPVQTNVSVFMSADDAPQPSMPCTALLDAQQQQQQKQEEGAPPQAAAQAAPAPAVQKDYSALPTVAVDEVAAGDTIAWGDVVMEHSRPVLVWHEGILQARTADALTVGPCDGAAGPVDVPVRGVFCLKRVRAAAEAQQQQQQQQQQATTTVPRRLSHPKSRGVSGVLSMLRRMGTEPSSA